MFTRTPSSTTSTRVRPRVLAAGAVLVASAVLVTACGDDSSDKGTTNSTVKAPVATVVDRAPVPAQPDQVVKFTAKEYSFEGPKQVKAGLTELTLTNQGMEDHQLALFRMKDGVTPGEVLGALGEKGLDAGKAYGNWVAGPNGAAAGATTSVVAELEPGTYIVACVIPDATGAPHAMKGMLTDLTVTPSKTKAASDPAGLPEVDLGDYHFTLPKGFDGHGPLVVKNSGKVVHEAVIAKLAPGKTVQDVIAYEEQEAPRKGAAPYTFVAGTTFLDPGGHARLDLDLEDGDYTFICFLPGPGGKEHALLGMVHPFSVS
jgi:uncharacterized cupredoxin-like copper-binding protein